MKTLLDQPIVLFSSHQQIVLDGDNNPSVAQLTLPNTPGAGAILRIGIHPRLSEVVYDLYLESPVLTSPGRGEFFDLSVDMERRIRAEQLRIAAHCREQADALLVQAERLEASACRSDKLVGDYDLAYWTGRKKTTGSVSSVSNVSGLGDGDDANDPADPTKPKEPKPRKGAPDLGRLASMLKERTSSR